MKFVAQLFALTIRHLIGLTENILTFWKRFWHIWNFVLLLIEDDSALKATWQIAFRGLVAYKTVAYNSWTALVLGLKRILSHTNNVSRMRIWGKNT